MRSPGCAPCQHLPFMAAHDGVAAGFSTALHGTMSLAGADACAGLENRRSFLENNQVDFRRLVCGRQTHSDRVAVITSAFTGRGAMAAHDGLDSTDGLVTAERGIPLAVFTADCLPVLLYHAEARVCGVVHAGWRGTHRHIVEKALSLFASQFNAGTGGVSAWLGPAIRNCCYRVGPEFSSFFPGRVDHRDSGDFFDLAAANRDQLVSAGVRQERIEDCGICTFCGNGYFSYRRDPACGRMITFIMLK